MEILKSASYIFLKLFIFLCLLHTVINTNCSTLKQVHLVFRHGERSPSLVYPNDPYNSLWADGLGSLTKRGKLQMYNLGERIRKKYVCFLPSYFSPNDVKVLSSYSDRCLMSAELFNSGLFIPKNEEIWNPDLLWQPIPISYKPRNEDNLIAAQKPCKNFEDSYKNLFDTPKYKKIMEDNSEMFEYLTEKTGMKVDTIRKVEELYNTLEIEQLQNLSLPGWTEKVFPEAMKPIAILCLASFTETEFMKKMKGGPFVKKVLANMKGVEADKESPRLFLYSGHDITLINILRTLGISDILKPNFAAYFIIELHHAPHPEVKLYYSDCGHCEERELKLTNVGDTCTIEDFERLLKPVIPDDWQKECQQMGINENT